MRVGCCYCVNMLWLDTTHSFILRIIQPSKVTPPSAILTKPI